MRRLLGALLLGAITIGAILLVRATGAPDAAVAPRQPVDEEPRVPLVDSGPTHERVVRAAVLPETPRTLLVDEVIDLTTDGAPERLRLYVDAERLATGRLAWDDGQRWLLAVRAGAASYVLFDDYVQIGTLRVWVVEERPGRSPTIVLLRETGAGIDMIGYRFVEGEGFAVRPVDSIAGNVVFSTPEFR